MEYLFHVNPALEGKKLMIYGMDTRGKMLFHALLQLGVRVEAFCTGKRQHGAGLERVFGKRVFSFGELAAHPEDFYVIVPGNAAHHDVQDLRQIGVKHIVVENITSEGSGVLLEEDFLAERSADRVPREGVPPRIEFGGISVNTRYDAETHILLVNGWFLPTSAYDEIQIYAEENFLGKAQLRCIREDVYVNFPQYAEYRSGWRLVREAELALPCRITVKCLHQGRVVKINEKILKISEPVPSEAVC